jgi:hypothetical protein
LYAESHRVPFVYQRSLGNQRVIVALNPSSKSKELQLSDIGATVPLLVQDAVLAEGMLRMEPVSFGVFLRHFP